MPWTLVGTSQQTQDSLAKLQKNIDKTKSIVLAGGGPTGVEFAWSLDRKCKGLEATRQAAKKELEKLNVKITGNSGVTETTRRAGENVLTLVKADGSKETLETDFFQPIRGITLKHHLHQLHPLEPNGRLKVTDSLRTSGYENPYLAGDAENADSYAATIREASGK
ncbi:uncharacterized protein A1O9_07743 [Exophiala aquamarina CBS 119918]|uniref:FAD/NAD(P)-binding domain-containing protein n=1 Tax=Exophiala aquamarina CBS 119918 TaxID=1182545 RepID=A0A072P8U5_9EURO|nr:uncharacterized protein A1O9_07743 [Exophiala aquamarina CBS 119918]KEF56162.1 hypothetical protein A1O9_07743 [Exophiala aquamarina CBS 119918]